MRLGQPDEFCGGGATAGTKAGEWVGTGPTCGEWVGATAGAGLWTRAGEAPQAVNIGEIGETGR
jgi:hypothetical protein